MLIVNSPKKYLEAKAMVLELLKYQNKMNIYYDLEAWQLPRFPITGNDLREHGVGPGKYMGLVINSLKQTWAQNDFNMTSEDLLKLVPNILSELNYKPQKKK